MKAVAAAMLLVLFLAVSMTGWRVFAQPDSVAVGGQYVIHRGEVVTGDLDAWFAQVTLEDGARVQGRIRAVSSVLDLGGKVDGTVLAVGSDVIVRITADLPKRPRSVEIIPYVILLPRMTQAARVASFAQ